MAATITFRPDDDARIALEELTADGTPVSEVDALATDAEDRAEAAQVLRDMEHLRAW